MMVTVMTMVKMTIIMMIITLSFYGSGVGRDVIDNAFFANLNITETGFKIYVGVGSAAAHDKMVRKRKNCEAPEPKQIREAKKGMERERRGDIASIGVREAWAGNLQNMV